MSIAQRLYRYFSGPTHQHGPRPLSPRAQVIVQQASEIREISDTINQRLRPYTEEPDALAAFMSATWNDRTMEGRKRERH